MISPRISVITACFNHGKYIHEMIDSVLNQTFQDFEIIIVNDGSTDNSREILDGIEHNKIRIIHSEHKGPSYARNMAVSFARASIIFNLDADDRIAEDLLEKAYEVFMKDLNTGIVYTNCNYFGARSGRMKSVPYSTKRMLISNRIVSAGFFRKEDWTACGGYSESFIYGLEDWDLWLSIIEQGRSVVKIPDSLFYYRTYHSPTQSRSGKRNSNRQKALESILLIYKRHIGLYSSHPSIAKRFRKYETENNSELIKKLKNLFFPLRYRLACMI